MRRKTLMALATVLTTMVMAREPEVAATEMTLDACVAKAKGLQEEAKRAQDHDASAAAFDRAAEMWEQCAKLVPNSEPGAATKERRGGNKDDSCQAKRGTVASVDTRSKFNNGYYDFKIANASPCPVCFTLNNCDQQPDGSAKCQDKPQRLGAKGSASGDIVGSNYRQEPIAANPHYCD
jgi:hypothetical protein